MALFCLLALICMNNIRFYLLNSHYDVSLAFSICERAEDSLCLQLHRNVKFKRVPPLPHKHAKTNFNSSWFYSYFVNPSMLDVICCHLYPYTHSCFEKVLLRRGLIVLVSSFYDFRKRPSPLKSTPLITTILCTCEWQPHSPATPDGLVAASEPRESAAGGRSIEEALIISNHLPGREAWHIFITMAMKTISDYHQDIKLATTQNDWLLNVMILSNCRRWQKQAETEEKKRKKKKSSLFLCWFIKLRCPSCVLRYEYWLFLCCLLLKQNKIRCGL